MIVGIDIGTSTIKVARLSDSGGVSLHRVCPTPSQPSAVLELVATLAGNGSFVYISLFRRALVDADRDRFVLAAASPGLDRAFVDSVPIELRSTTAILDPLAPVHRWRHSMRAAKASRFELFDAWLAERLTGRAVITECAAWLTGLWDTSAGQWSATLLHRAGLGDIDLPTVSSDFEAALPWVVPFAGDHQSTAVAAALSCSGEIAVLELGTAFALLRGSAPYDRLPHYSHLAVVPPLEGGYFERIDAHFARRCRGEMASAPSWMTAEQIRDLGVDSIGVVSAALEIASPPRPAVWFASGGHVSTSLLGGVEERTGTRIVFRPSIAAPVGALLVACRVAGVDLTVSEGSSAFIALEGT